MAPHVWIDDDGTLFMVGSHVKGKPAYHLIKIVPTGDGELINEYCTYLL